MEQFRRSVFDLAYTTMRPNEHYWHALFVEKCTGTHTYRLVHRVCLPSWDVFDLRFMERTGHS